MAISSLYVGLMLLVALPTAVLAGSLYPKCAGTAQSANAPWSATATPVKVISFPWSSAAIALDCLGFEVKSMNPNTNGCDQATLDRNKPYRIYVRASSKGASSHGEPSSYMWDVDDTVGGSVEKLLYSVPSHHQQTDWSLWFENQSPSRCTLQVHMIATTKDTTITEQKIAAPGLVALSPTTVYENKRTLVGFKVIGGPSSHDKVRVRDLYGDADARSWTEITRVTKASTLSEYGLAGSDNAAFEHDFPVAGNYQLEYQRNGGKWTTVAHIVVYSGNPAFFTVDEGAGPDGQMYVNTETTITFHGNELNSHAKTGDQVKFVDQKLDKCTEGADAAGGVPLATDLTPGNRRHLHQTHWIFTISKGGMFRVCYKRKGKSWVEVALRDDLPDMGPSTEIPRGMIPIPTHPDTHQQCHVAPVRHDQPSYDTAIELTLNTDVITSSFRSGLAKYLCISETDLVVLDLMHTTTHSGHRRARVYIDIVCNSYGRADLCLGSERKNYIMWVWGSNSVHLTNLGVTSVAEVPVSTLYDVSVFVAPNHAGHPVLAVLLVLCALGGLGAAAYMYVKKNGMPTTNRFMPIGHAGPEGDDDDDDDDQNAPAAGTGSKPRSSGGVETRV